MQKIIKIKNFFNIHQNHQTAVLRSDEHDRRAQKQNLIVIKKSH
jgi:hypothetical protein